MRTCVGCRAKQERSHLVRVALQDGALLPDKDARMPGRGAWIHPEPSCLEKALTRRAFARALRVENPDATALTEPLPWGSNQAAYGASSAGKAEKAMGTR
ncbi:MAG: YlxR family protein [Buchananella hordeovulneris]|nr:YlxR family protein [Buchananella hordeovulneris]